MGSHRSSRRRFLVILGTSGAAAILGCSPTARVPGEPAPAPGSLNAGPRALIEPPVPPLFSVVTPTGSAALLATATPTAQPTTPATATAIETPSPTAVPPTATAMAPTATPVPPTATVPPPTPTATPLRYDPARLTDRLAAAVTSYAGSIPERAWNVELAAKKISGTRVGPGEVFSFNGSVGPMTLAAGFKVGYGITMRADRPQTVPSVAGGICQVATTVFQAAFWAGMKFVERHHHLYWISRYGQRPSGRIGMDATVDEPGVDLKFINTTDDWIRIDMWTDGAKLGAAIVGVDPGWEVDIREPRVYDVVKANQAWVREETLSLPPGREIDVEHAEDGFTVTLSRLTKMEGMVIDEYTFTNRYRPSRNVVLVGVRQLSTPTRVAQPTASPEPPTATPVTSDAATIAAPTQSTPPPPQPPPQPPPRQPAAAPASPPASGAPAGQVRVPGLVGMPEGQARAAIDAAGLVNAYTNYQGPGDVPPAALNSVPVGHVLSQTPGAGTMTAPGTRVHIAVRKA